MTTLTESFQRLAALSAAGRLPEGVEGEMRQAQESEGQAYVNVSNTNDRAQVSLYHDDHSGAMGALMLLVQALKPSGWRFQRMAIIGSEVESWAGISRHETTDKFDFTTDETRALAACIVADVEEGREN